MPRGTYRNPRMVKPGEKYGKLTILEHIDEYHSTGSYQSKCVCDCGTECIRVDSWMVSGHQNSCGCGQGKRPGRHGKARTVEYKIWDGMIQRCTNPNSTAWDDYGGRGIKVCDRWLDFVNFYEDVGKRPPVHTIGRINNDGNYEPGNVEWQTVKQQNCNTRYSHKLTYNNKTLTIAEWCELTGITQSALYQRIYYGWTVDRALTEPVRKKNKQQ